MELFGISYKPQMRPDPTGYKPFYIRLARRELLISKANSYADHTEPTSILLSMGNAHCNAFVPPSHTHALSKVAENFESDPN